jgi:hypothetical protein
MSKPETLDFFFSSLTALIEKLPLSHESKNLLWIDSYGKFYEEKIISKDGSYTRGVTTEWQLQNYYHEFLDNLNKTSIKVEGNCLEKLEELDPSRREPKGVIPTLNRPTKTWQARIWSTFV